MSRELGKQAHELDERKVPYAWATVVHVEGSAPRHIGAKMIISGEEIFGTIGGGTLEFRLIDDARAQLRTGTPKKFSYPLGPELGQCCGGSVDIFVEPVRPQKEIVLFGAGHIAEELVPMLKKLHFCVALVDERPERIGLPAFNCADKKMNELPSDALNDIAFDEGLHIVVLTHEHKDDEAIVEFCLKRPFRYLGLIGSKTKWEKFKARYRSRGITEDEMARVKTPIGLDIGSETPFEIAVSIIAELIKLGRH